MSGLISAAIKRFVASLADAVDMSKGAALVGGVGRVIDSIAALKTLPKTGAKKAFVLGYYAPGDGGGGAYYFDAADVTSLDNGGTVIVASDGGRWKLAIQSEVTVKQFGAVGDGVTINDVPIEKAIAAFKNQGSPTWQSWALVFNNGVFRVSQPVVIKNQQFGRVIGNAATLVGNFAGTVLQLGDMTGVADNLWFHIEGMMVSQESIGAGAAACRAYHNYSCTFSRMFFYGGRNAFTLDGNANLVEGCTFRGAKDANVVTAGASNNQANLFHVCSSELSAGYGYDLSVAAGAGGITEIRGGYVEQNALASIRVKNSQKAIITGLYFNLQNAAPGVLLDGTVGGDFKNPQVTVEHCNILGDGAVSTQFIKEASTSSISAQYRENRVEGGLIDLYGGTPRSINNGRKRKRPYVANADSFLDADANGIPDGWTRQGSGAVTTAAAFSPYGAGASVVITPANQYIYQQINVPANALVRVSVRAKCSGAAAIAALQCWSLGLGGQYATASTVTTEAGGATLQIFLSSTDRGSATAFLLLLRNTGATDNALFCDLEIEDMTN